MSLETSLVLIWLSSSSALAGGPSSELLQRSAAYYRSLNSFDVKGHVTTIIRGSTATVSVAVENASGMMPDVARGAERKNVITFDQPKVISSRGNRSPLEPTSPVQLPHLVHFTELDRDVTEVHHLGSGIVHYHGKNHVCEIFDVVYDEFRPAAPPSRVRFWIDPATLFVLKETHSDPGMGEWIFIVENISLRKPMPEPLLSTLNRFRISTQSTPRPTWVGRSMPNLILKDVSGNPVRLADFRGRPLLLDFWASYCEPCKAAALVTEKIAREYESAGLQVWTITEDTADEARLWLASNHHSLPTIIDRRGIAFRVFGIQSVPAALLVDANGKIVEYWPEVYDANAIRAALEKVHP